MKLDKEAIIAIGVCMALLLLWPTFFPQPDDGAVESNHGRSDTIAAAASSATASAVTASDMPPPSPMPAPPLTGAVSAEPDVKLPPVTLENNQIMVAVDVNRGGLASVTLKEYFKHDNAGRHKSAGNVVLGAGGGMPALELSGAGVWTSAFIDFDKSADEALLLKRRVTVADAVLDLEQSWRLTGDYRLDYDIAIVNNSDKSVRLEGMRISVGDMPPLLELCGDKVRNDRHKIYYGGDDRTTSISASEDDEDFAAVPRGTFKWLGLANKYFACVLKSRGAPFATAVNSRLTGEHGDEVFHDVSTAAVIGTVELPPGGRFDLKTAYFAGPKTIDMLNGFDSAACAVMELSYFSWFEWISQMFLAALTKLKSICGSFGWAIILLTVIVKAVLWPVTHKANASMRKMQKLQPKIQALKERYKDNPQMMNTKTMELYRDEKVNPLGGCLPIVLQIPVFLALYSSLDGSIELRHTPFLWVADLSQPDTIGHVFGLAIHPLVLVMTALMLVQQALTPSAADPVQQKMMMIMPVVMLFILYNLPAGLTLYWTVSQLISIIQLMVNRAVAAKEERMEAAA